MNKHIFKEMYDKKINKENNYQQIISRIKEKNKIRYWKWFLLPISIFMIMLVVALNTKNNLLEDVNKNLIRNENNYNDIVIINDMSEKKTFYRTDGKVIEEEGGFNIPSFEVLQNLNIPDYFSKEENYAIFVRSDSSKDNYDKLGHYVKYYSFEDKIIEIKYSLNDIPARDYGFHDGSLSTLNGFDLTIYKYKELLMTVFKYKDLYIDIETANITEEEFVALLKSIIR